MSLRSPSNPNFERSGFQPLSNMEDIPLSQMKTNSSSGARKPGDAAIYETTSSQEKAGLFHRKNAVPGGKRKLKKVDSRPNRVDTDGQEISVNGLGRLYNKIVNFSVVTRYMVFVVPVGLILAVPIVCFAVLTKAPTKPGEKDQRLFLTTGVRGVFFWTWIEVVWLSIWVSKLVAKLAPAIFMALCGVVSSGTRKYASIITAVEIPLSLVFWAIVSLVTFTTLTSTTLNGQQFRWVTVVKNLLVPALIATVIFLIQSVLVQMLSISYHKRSFSGRIRESKNAIHLLGLLYDASRSLFPMYCKEFAEEDYIINDSIEAMIAKTTGQSGSATPLKLIGKVGILGDKVTSVFGNIASEITGKEVFNPTSAHSIVIEALEKTKSSEALARRLWMSFVVEGKEALYPEDIVEVLGPSRRDEADESFAALDSDGNGDISLEEMIMKVVEVGRERKALSTSMHDIGQAIGVLNSVISVILFVIVIFIFVAFQNTNFVTTLATAGTTLLSLSFVFAASVQEFLGSCIFLFVKHPFDVGDRVDIDGKLLIVEQISLLYTIFKRIDTMKMVQSPNIVLNNLWVENVSRSNSMKEQLDMFISFDTPLSDIELLREEMEKFVRHADNKRDFQRDICLEATGIGNMDKIQLKVEICHKSNWHNETVRAARRSKFMCALVLALRKIPIYAPGGGGEALGGPNNPGYSVSVSDAEAAEARDKATKAKEAKRLVPTEVADPSKSSEENAAENLNTRPAAQETAEELDESTDHRRSNDIDDLRQGLLKRESTRGRRRKGETLPLTQQGSNPNLMVTQPSPNRGTFPHHQSMGEALDEEAEVGMHGQPLNTNPYNNSYNNMYSPPTAQQQRQARDQAPGYRPAGNSQGQAPR